MKKLLAPALLAAVLGSGASSHAALSMSTDMTFATEYIFRGIKLADNTFQPAIEASIDDFYIGIWGAVPTEKRNSMGYSDEWDFYAGYGFDLSDNLRLDLGATYYYYPKEDLDDTFEAFVGLNWNLDGWTPSIYGYYDLDLKTWTAETSLGYSIPLANAGVSLDLRGHLGYVIPDEADDYWYYGASMVVPYQINNTASVSAGVHYASNTVEGLEGDHVYFTVSVTMGF